MLASRTGTFVAALVLGTAVCASAQDRDDRYQAGTTRIDPGTTIEVRTNEPIDSSRTDYRVYNAVVDRDIHGDNGLAIPRGSQVELIVRQARDRDLILDLESITIGDHRYAVRTDTNRVDANNAGLVGEIVGAINGYRGEYVRLPEGSVLSFRLQRPLDVDVRDAGVMREGHHYHDWYRRGPTN
jgi:hypothetical protein